MRPTRGNTSAKIVQAARALRQEMTPSEQKLWAALRGSKLAGLKFRRQHPFDRFVIDFFCVESQLAIEIDGNVHNEPQVAARDLERTKFLEAHRIRVLRFSVEEVDHRLPEVLEKIKNAAK